MLGNLFNQKKFVKNDDGSLVQVNPDAPQSGQPDDNEQPATSAPTVGGQIGSRMDPSMRQNLSALSHLDQRALQALHHAQEETKKIKQQKIEPEQVLLGLLYDEEIYKLLESFQVDAASLQKELEQKEKPGNFDGQPTLSDASQSLFDHAYKDAKARDVTFVSPEDILLAMFNQNLGAAKSLEEKGVKKENIQEKLTKSPSFTTGKKSVIEKYGTDLTEEAKKGKLDPITGRDKEIDRMFHILLRRTKNNPIIIGEAGVGKTAIVEGVAQAIVDGKAPKDLANKRIIQIDLSSLVAGASHRGEFEERLKGVVNEAMASDGQIVLFIDEIHTLIGTGDQEGALDASNIIKPYLARGQLQLIGTTTTTEYRKHFEKDKAFERRFQPILAEEPTEEVAVEMLKVLKPKYEKFHSVVITDDALIAAVKLSKKYIGERYLPDKAVDLLDEASADVKLKNSEGKRGNNQVVKTDIEQVVSAWTGIPITKLTEDESQKLLKLEDKIHERFIDQQEAVTAVAEAVRRGRIGLAPANRPIASFIFLGPTGVGKTELAKTLAELMFGKDEALIRLDMSEYMEKHEVAKLIGAPPGYVGYEEGGQLTEAVRTKPYSIVLLDEVEKAHPDVFNILLQLLEDGRLTDNKGNTISFKNTIVICTSNIGSALIQQHLSQKDPNTHPTPEQDATSFAELTQLVTGELRKFFRPELLNRFDDVVIFKPLRREDMMQIARLSIGKTGKLLKEQGFGLDITEAALLELSEEGYDPVYGARPLRRLIQVAIENPVALLLISKKFAQGDIILIDYDKAQGKFVFNKGTQRVEEPVTGAQNEEEVKNEPTKEQEIAYEEVAGQTEQPIPLAPSSTNGIGISIPQDATHIDPNGLNQVSSNDLSSHAAGIEPPFDPLALASVPAGSNGVPPAQNNATLQSQA